MTQAPDTRQMARLARLNTEATCAEDVDGDPGPRHEADGQAGQTEQHTFLELTLYFHQGYASVIFLTNIQPH